MILSLDSIEQFLSSLSVNGGAENTQKAYKADLMGLLKWIEQEELTEPLMNLESAAATYLTKHRQQWAVSTLNRKLASLRAYGRWAGEPQFLVNYKTPPTPPGQPHPLPEGIDGVKMMLDAARQEHHKTLIILEGLLGLRVAEALSITPSSFDFSQPQVWLNVRGKGDKVRRVPVSNDVLALLAVPLARTAPNQPLVPISDRNARRAISRIGKRAGINKHRVASHDLRMTFGTAAYEVSGNDLRATQELLGHANSSTTEGYTGVSDQKRVRAANVLA